MYKSPIEIIQGEVEAKMEGEVLKAIQRVGVNVDKEELIKAIRYDRAQYEKGYEDGLHACRWIPCKERMPVLNVEDKSVDREQSFERDGYLFPFDIGKEFLVTDKYGHVHPSTFWLIGKAFDDVNAIAWMEKPEPWKGE